MAKTVFYSWQSDLPHRTNRDFIQRALEEAVTALNANGDETIVVDRDTQGMAGSPDILRTILEKIEKAAVFVCDLSFVAKNDHRQLPNPNVLVEFGYAMRALGMNRIVMVFNSAYGEVGKLPFDVGRFRALPYYAADNTKERTPEQES